MTCPKPSPSRLVLGFWPKTCRPRLRIRTGGPTVAGTSYAAPYRPPPSLSTTVSNGAPKTKLTQPSLGLLSQNSPNPLVQLNVRPHDHRNLVHGTTAPPPVICLHLFQRRAQNQAHAAQFRAFVPKTRQ